MFITLHRRQWPKPSQREKNARRQSDCLRRPYKRLGKEEKWKAREKENTEFQTKAGRDKKAFLNEQCKEIEEDDRMGKIRELFKKTGNTKGTFHAKMGSIKDRNGETLTEAEDIKKRWQEYRECESEMEGCSVVSDSLQPYGLYSPWNSPGQNTGVGSLSLLQGIFPTQGSNPDLLHCRQIFYQLSHKGSPEYTEELYKKGLNDPENHGGMITHPEPDILSVKSSGP